MIFRGPFLSLGFLTKNAVDNAEIGWFWFSAEVFFFFGVCGVGFVKGIVLKGWAISRKIREGECSAFEIA